MIRTRAGAARAAGGIVRRRTQGPQTGRGTGSSVWTESTHGTTSVPCVDCGGWSAGAIPFVVCPPIGITGLRHCSHVHHFSEPKRMIRSFVSAIRAPRGLRRHAGRPASCSLSPCGKTAPPWRVLTMPAAVGVCRTPVSRLFIVRVGRYADRVLIAAAGRDHCGTVLPLSRVTRLKGRVDARPPVWRQAPRT
jgi:hypothetical protein